MFKQAHLIFMSLFLTAGLAHGNTKVEGVEIPASIALKTPTPVTLTTVSAGLRKKKVFGLLPVNIYVSHFSANDVSKLVKSPEGILASLQSAGPVQMRLILKRSLKGSDISNSFREALQKNGVDFAKLAEQNLQPLAALMSEIESVKSANEGEVFSLTADWRDSAQIWIEMPGGTLKSLSANSESLTKLFSIWLGEPVDDKMKELKAQLLK